MLKFDKIKLVTNIDNVKITNNDAFDSIIRDGIVVSQKFHQESPYLIMIKLDYIANEAVIEFTGKVLKSNYKNLISIDTIRQCFDSINEMGICLIDVEGVMMNAQVVKCDVTKDVEGLNIKQVTSYIKSHLSSFQAYQCRKMRNGNLIIEKNVTSKKIMKRLTIYDKGKEMTRANNMRFSNECGCTDDFEGVCRFEMNLNTKEQIRNALMIEDTGLMSVLSSSANPIYDFMTEVISPSRENISLPDKKSYMAMLVLKDNDYDLEKVEAKMRAFHPRGTSIPKIMEPFRQVLESLSSNEGGDLYDTLMNSLKD